MQTINTSIVGVIVGLVVFGFFMAAKGEVGPAITSAGCWLLIWYSMITCIFSLAFLMKACVIMANKDARFRKGNALPLAALSMSLLQFALLIIGAFLVWRSFDAATGILSMPKFISGIILISAEFVIDLTRRRTNHPTKATD